MWLLIGVQYTVCLTDDAMDNIWCHKTYGSMDNMWCHKTYGSMDNMWRHGRYMGPWIIILLD